MQIKSSRIISGQFKNRRILSPQNAHTHPMSERARQAIFNALGDQIIDARFLDLYAGTGAVGLEALSRGAKFVAFVEHHPAAFRALSSNLSDLDPGQYQTIKSAVTAFLADNTEFYDLIFLDPPYSVFDSPDFISTIFTVNLFRALAPSGIIIVSHPAHIELSHPLLNNLSEYHHAKAKITFFSLKS